MVEIALNILVCLGILYALIEAGLMFYGMRQDRLRHDKVIRSIREDGEE